MAVISSPPGFIVAAPQSGAGKTTVTLGLMRAFRRRGVVVQPFKCGPDYIDPAHHTVAAGRDSINLDTWAMHPTLISHLLADANQGAALAIAEGVMGLFDGVAEAGQSARGATADLAALLRWPIVLVLDVAGQAETAAALALGCARYRDDIAIAGVILNRVASARHLDMIKPAFERIDMPIFGSLANNGDLLLPERHLGLVQAQEVLDVDGRIERIALAIETGVDLDRLMRAARGAQLDRAHAATARAPIRLVPPGQRIALAHDTAFSFIYPHVLSQWRSAGAEILPFSPLADQAPSPDADAVWLPGGYPELHAGRLSQAQSFRRGMAALADRGAAIHGECGGYMVLGDGLEDASGERHAMLGLLPLETSFRRRKLHLGYRRVRLRKDCSLGRNGARLMGHEFHYASTLSSGGDDIVDCTDAAGHQIAERGGCRRTVTGTFFHVIDREGA